MMLNEWKPDILFYHGNCTDGFGAAFAVWKKWGDDVQYVAASNNDRNEAPKQNLKDKNVLIADFCYSIGIINELGLRAKSVVILDHHKTSREDLETVVSFMGDCHDVNHNIKLFGNVLSWFDMNQSGAMLTWRFCHGLDSDIPELIQYIQDRDIWLNKLPETKEVSIVLNSEPFIFKEWDRYVSCESTAMAYLRQRGRILLPYFNSLIEAILPNAKHKTFAGHDKVPVVNAPYFMASDLGNRMLKEWPKAPFAVVYYDLQNNRGYSLRSEDDRVDVSEIARQFGGGGHRNASGFKSPKS